MTGSGTGLVGAGWVGTWLDESNFTDFDVDFFFFDVNFFRKFLAIGLLARRTIAHRIPQRKRPDRRLANVSEVV